MRQRLDIDPADPNPAPRITRAILAALTDPDAPPLDVYRDARLILSIARPWPDAVLIAFHHLAPLSAVAEMLDPKSEATT